MRRVSFFFLLWCGCFSMLQVLGKTIPSFAGPYRLIAEHVTNESEEFQSTGDFWCRLYLTHPRPREKQYVRGTCYNAIALGDQYRLEVRASKWSNNQWKRNAFVAKLDRACSDAFIHGKFLFDGIFYPHERKCPLPRIGLREIKNQSVDPVFPQFPVLPYGHYLITAAFIKGGTTQGLFVSIVDVVPKL